jgi:hypothetical protein
MEDGRMARSSNRKAFEGALVGMGRMGLQELGSVLYADSNIVQSGPAFGIYGREGQDLQASAQSEIVPLVPANEPAQQNEATPVVELTAEIRERAMAVLGVEERHQAQGVTNEAIGQLYASPTGPTANSNEVSSGLERSMGTDQHQEQEGHSH